MIPFAIVGYDHAHLPKYVPAIAAHPEARVAAVVAPGANRALARADAERHGARYLERVEDLPDDVQAAYVGTPPDEHLAVVRALAERGVHILLDKPIATNLADADAILETTRRHGVRLMVPFNPRYQVPVQRLKAMIDGGDLGELKSILATKYGKLPRGIPGLDTEWFFDKARAGFGGFGDIGIHAVDGLRWLTGAEFRSVRAIVTRSIHPDIGVDDTGTAIYEMDNGVIAALQAGWMNPRGNPTWLSVSFEALGTRGGAVVEKPYQDLAVADLERSERVPWLRRDVDLLVDEFVRAIREDRPPAITGEDARAALEATLAAYASAATGEVVTLPLTGRAAEAVAPRGR